MDDIEKKAASVNGDPPSSTISIAEEDRIEPPTAKQTSNQDLSSPQLHIPSPKPPSIRSGTATHVPIPQRRGLLARLALIPEAHEPKAYSRRTKWTITFIVAVAAAAAPMGSAIIMPALLPVSHSLHATPTATNLSVALYMLSMSVFPIWWSSFSETLGRRTIYIVSFALFTLFGVLSAVATSIAMLIVMRVLSGGAAASVQAVGAGTIADIWEPKERGRAMGIFYLGPLCGPLLAPIIGGALAQGLGWRSTQWFLVLYGGFVLAGLIFCLPETLKNRRDLAEEAAHEAEEKTTGEKEVNEEQSPNADAVRPSATPPPPRSTTPSKHTLRLRTRKYLSLLRRCLLDPLLTLTLLRHPPILLTVYYAAITFGSLYFLNISIEDTFSRPPYTFPTLIIGLLYIPNSVGYFLASVLGGRWLDYIMHREARRKGRYDARGKLVLKPMDRMRENAWCAAVLFPGALVWYGWAVEKGVHWIVPMLANFFFGLGSMLIFAMATTMLTEFLPRRASAGIAVNNFVRNIFSCVGGVVAAPLIRAVGNGWLCTVLGLAAFVSGVGVIWAMGRWGEEWRGKMEREIEGGERVETRRGGSGGVKEKGGFCC